ncbi:MAG: hypothetical protein LUG26_05150 [Ruminococcus sp.]|nr:hypothetical protein [Ruminococcus sp.]
MDYLQDFDLQIYMYDGMLTEMGRGFAEENCNDYICRCLDTADLYLKNGGKKINLVRTINKYIDAYEDEKDWQYIDLELDFLHKLRGLVHKI